MPARMWIGKNMFIARELGEDQPQPFEITQKHTVPDERTWEELIDDGDVNPSALHPNYRKGTITIDRAYL